MSLHATVIRTIGRRHLADVLDLPLETVKSWSKRGIPGRYWHRIVPLVGGKLPDLTIEELERTKPATSSDHTGAP